LQELEDMRRNGETMSRVLGNPINAFHLLRRLTIVWTEMKAAFVTQSNTSRTMSITSRINEENPPFNERFSYILGPKKLRKSRNDLRPIFWFCHFSRNVMNGFVQQESSTR
jgi:hypothetical protein